MSLYPISPIEEERRVRYAMLRELTGADWRHEPGDAPLVDLHAVSHDVLHPSHADYSNPAQDFHPLAVVGAPHHGGHHGGGHHHGGHGGVDVLEAWALDLCPDGWIELPDGTCVHAIALEGASAGHGVLVGQTARGRYVRVGAVSAPAPTPGDAGGGGLPPHTDPGHPAAGATGTAPPDPNASSVDANWQAVASFVEAMPAGTAAESDLVRFYSDLSAWHAYYSTYATQGNVLGLTNWESLAGDWAAHFKAASPTQATSSAFPSWGAASSLAQAEQVVTSAASSTATALKWIVIAVAVGVGLWLLWPVLAHAL